MRLNVYTDELSDRVEVVTSDDLKTGVPHFGIRFYTKPSIDEDAVSAITLWGDVRGALRKGAAALDQYLGEPNGLLAIRALLEALPDGTLGTVSQPVPPYRQDLIPVALEGLRLTIARVAKASEAAQPMTDDEVRKSYLQHHGHFGDKQ